MQLPMLNAEKSELFPCSRRKQRSASLRTAVCELQLSVDRKRYVVQIHGLAAAGRDNKLYPCSRCVARRLSGDAAVIGKFTVVVGNILIPDVNGQTGYTQPLVVDKSDRRIHAHLCPFAAGEEGKVIVASAGDRHILPQIPLVRNIDRG